MRIDRLLGLGVILLVGACSRSPPEEPLENPAAITAAGRWTQSREAGVRGAAIPAARA